MPQRLHRRHWTSSPRTERSAPGPNLWRPDDFLFLVLRRELDVFGNVPRAYPLACQPVAVSERIEFRRWRPGAGGIAGHGAIAAHDCQCVQPLSRPARSLRQPCALRSRPGRQRPPALSIRCDTKLSIVRAKDGLELELDFPRNRPGFLRFTTAQFDPSQFAYKLE